MPTCGYGSRIGASHQTTLSLSSGAHSRGPLALPGACLSGTTGGGEPKRLFLVAFDPGNRRALPDRDQTGFCVDTELGPGVSDVEVAHGQLADTIGRCERRVLHLLHAQPLRLIGEVGAHRVQDRVVVATA